MWISALIHTPSKTIWSIKTVTVSNIRRCEAPKKLESKLDLKIYRYSMQAITLMDIKIISKRAEAPIKIPIKIHAHVGSDGGSVVGVGKIVVPIPTWRIKPKNDRKIFNLIGRGISKRLYNWEKSRTVNKPSKGCGRKLTALLPI